MPFVVGNLSDNPWYNLAEKTAANPTLDPIFTKPVTPRAFSCFWNDPIVEYVEAGIGLRATKLPDGWKKYVHFHGSIYFYNPDLRLLTTGDITKETIREEIESVRDDMVALDSEDGYWNSLGLSNADVVSLYFNEEEPISGEWVIFNKGEQIDTGEKCAERMVLSATFWRRVEEFPMHLDYIIPFGPAAFKSALACAANEAILDETPTLFPFTDAQIERLMEMYECLHHAARTNSSAIPVFNWFLGRTLDTIEGRRQVHARLHPSNPAYPGFDLKIPAPVCKRTWQFNVIEACLTCILFGSQGRYWKQLQQVRPSDRAENMTMFRAMLSEFLAEWADSNLLATVLVGSNVAFIAIPDITNVQRTASLASAMFALLSIGSGLYHTWHHRIKINTDLDDAYKYLNHARNISMFHIKPKEDVSDLLIIAAFLSVPTAALSWGILFFAIALFAFCIQNTEWKGRVLILVILVIILAVLSLVGAVSWRIWVKPMRFGRRLGRRIWRRVVGMIEALRALLDHHKADLETGNA
ncbi:unnamed protein product [Somion occarium]|uniref:WW domain-containing protein n=1 Tax=Somion occarium TaxID=3059160 RepID=A0ABP1CW56_9APHY